MRCEHGLRSAHFFEHCDEMRVAAGRNPGEIHPRLHGSGQVLDERGARAPRSVHEDDAVPGRCVTEPRVHRGNARQLFGRIRSGQCHRQGFVPGLWRAHPIDIAALCVVPGGEREVATVRGPGRRLLDDLATTRDSTRRAPLVAREVDQVQLVERGEGEELPVR